MAARTKRKRRMKPHYRLLEWDTDFFGFRVGRLLLPEMELKELQQTLTQMRREAFRLVYWPASGMISPDEAKRLGGRLVDRKTTFIVDFSALMTDAFISLDKVEPYRPSMPDTDFDELAVQSGVYSRFAVDPDFPREKFIALYTLWIRKSLRKEIADEVLVICEGERAAGMVTLGNKGGKGDIGLLSVSSDHRGKKYGEMLVRGAQRYFMDHGYRSGQVVTQGENAAACALYQKCGYSVGKVDYFYHFWL